MISVRRYHDKFTLIRMRLERLLKGRDYDPKKYVKYTGRAIRAAVLHRPNDLRVMSVPEEAVLPEQVRIDVHYCGVSGCDILHRAGKYHTVLEEPTVLGYEAAGTILEMGRTAHEKTGLQIDEEVVVHNDPLYGGYAETCLANYKDVFKLSRRVTIEGASALLDDYAATLLSLGRRARLQRGEYVLVNTHSSRSALAVADLGSHVFHAKVIGVCDDPIRAESLKKMGAIASLPRATSRLPEEIEALSKRKRLRIIVDTVGGSHVSNILQCIEHEGVFALLSWARDAKDARPVLRVSDYSLIAVDMKHYKAADTIAYRETIEEILDHRSRCTIRPRISAVFGLNHINDAFDYYADIPNGKVVIDLKNPDRWPDDYQKSLKL